MYSDFPKAKPTSAFGVDFRSLLEASWAMFFQYLNIPWLYEPATFIFNRQAYIPDFCISPTANLDEIYWLEIKPSDYGSIREHRHHKFGRLVSERLNHSFYLIAGGPWDCWYYGSANAIALRDLLHTDNDGEKCFGEDVSIYIKIITKCRRFLKQKGLVKYAKTLQDLEWYHNEMPNCYEVRELYNQCREHTQGLSPLVPAAKVYATLLELTDSVSRQRKAASTPPGRRRSSRSCQVD